MRLRVDRAATEDYLTGVMNDLPQPIPGPELASLRKSVGVKQVDLAKRLGIHRVALYGWERAAQVDGLKAARYHRALREIVEEAVA